MAMGIAISIGLREQSQLAGIFMLHWATMVTQGHSNHASPHS